MHTLYARQESVASENTGPTQSVIITALVVLAFVFVGLRFRSRYLTAFSVGMDDWLLVAGLVCE
jgi:hypothetical protein